MTAAILCLSNPGEMHPTESRELDPAASLRAVAADAGMSAARLRALGVLDVHDTAIEAHHVGRTRLFDRSADAAERVGAGAG